MLPAPNKVPTDKLFISSPEIIRNQLFNNKVAYFIEAKEITFHLTATSFQHRMTMHASSSLYMKIEANPKHNAKILDSYFVTVNRS